MLDPALASAVGFALTAGIVTFFSPCAYPLLPGYVGYYVTHTEGERSSLGGTVLRGLVAGGGVLFTFAALFGAAYLVGQQVLSGITALEPLVGVVLIGFGIVVVLDVGPSISIQLPKRRAGVAGFGIFGAGYALAAAGCVAPVFLGVVAQAMSMEPSGALLVVGTYVGSVIVLMVALTVATGVGLVAGAGWIREHTDTLKRLAGAVMILAGLGQLYVVYFVDAPTI